MGVLCEENRKKRGEILNLNIIEVESWNKSVRKLVSLITLHAMCIDIELVLVGVNLHMLYFISIHEDSTKTYSFVLLEYIQRNTHSHCFI
jgi:hypothetical protein